MNPEMMQGFDAAMAQAPAQAAQSAPMPGPMGGEQPAARQATPEEQQQYNQFVGMSMTLLYSEKFMPRAIEMLKSEKTTMEGVAKVAAQVAFRVYSDAKKRNIDMPASVVLHGGMELVQLVIELALAAQIPPMPPEEEQMAFYGAADKFRELLESNNMVDPEMMRQEQQELDAMHNDGRLAQVMGEIQRAQSGAAPQMPKGLG